MVSTVQTRDVNNDTRKVLLSIDDLHVWFELRRFGFGRAGYVKAVDGVTFDVHQGEAIAVVGESGCGKSSLMKTILALYKPTKGKVIFDDKDLAELDGKGLHLYHSHVGYVQQDPYGALPPFMNVQRILEEPLIIGGIKGQGRAQPAHPQGDGRSKADAGGGFPREVPAYVERRATTTCGDRAAMIMGPKFLVADEPVSMLDASVRVEILKLLRGLQESHNSIGLSIHARSFYSQLFFRTHLCDVRWQLGRKGQCASGVGSSAPSLHHGFVHRHIRTGCGRTGKRSKSFRL